MISTADIRARQAKLQRALGRMAAVERSDTLSSVKTFILGLAIVSLGATAAAARNNYIAIHGGYRYFRTVPGNFTGQFGAAFDVGYVYHTGMLTLRTPF